MKVKLMTWIRKYPKLKKIQKKRIWKKYDIFKKNIYEFCTNNFKKALNINKNKKKKSTKKNSNLMFESDGREELVSNSEQNGSEQEDDNNKKEIKKNKMIQGLRPAAWKICLF